MKKEANNNAISVRYEAVKGDKATGCINHQLRVGRMPGYVDQARIADNSVMVFRQTNTQKMTKELAESRKAKGQSALRKDAKIFIDSIITFGTSAQEKLASLSPEEQDQMFLRVAQDQQKKHGHELLQLVVHRDEQALHAHALYRASRVENGKEKSWSYNKKDLSRFQDIAAESVKGLGIERGYKKVDRLKAGASWKDVTHKSVQQLHREMKADFDQAQALKKQRKKLETYKRPDPPPFIEKYVFMRKFPFVKKAKIVLPNHMKLYENRLKEWQISQVAERTLGQDKVRQQLNELLRDNELIQDGLLQEQQTFKANQAFAQKVVQKLCEALDVSLEDVQRFVCGDLAQEEFLKLVEKVDHNAPSASSWEVGY